MYMYKLILHVKKSALDDWLAIARNSVDIDTDLFISGEFLVQQSFLVCAICLLGTVHSLCSRHLFRYQDLYLFCTEMNKTITKYHSPRFIHILT